jgi:hypothetical protein
MGLPPSPPLPIRLLPTMPRVWCIPAAGLSLVLHGGAVALAASVCGRWLGVRPAETSLSHSRTTAVSFVTIATSARPDAPRSHGGKAGDSQSARNRPPQSQVFESSLFALIPVGLNRAELAARPEPPTESVQPELASEAGAASVAEARGITTVAELRSRQRDACPVLRRPPGFAFPQEGLEVAVAFVVDTLGMVDPTTLRVVSRPGEPDLVTGLVPHIYAVGVKLRKDPTLRDAGPAYGAILADDLVRHVATLQFRPASRDGHPSRSGVLVACRAVQ